MSDQDYLLSPTRHADEIAAEAPALAVILRGAQFKARGVRFENADAEAIKRQSAFRRWAVLAHGGMGVTTMLTAVALALPPGWDHRPVVSWSLGLGAAVAGGCSTISLIMLRQGEKLRRWMEARAEAETERLAYFKAVVDAVPPGDAVLLEDVLDYICRYQVRVQMTYYEKRGQRHEKVADRLLFWGAVAAGVGTLGVGSLLAGSGAWPALLGVFCTAVAGFVAAQEGIGQDKRNGERYSRTLKFLSKIAEEEDEVRAKVKAGDKAALVDWVERLHQHLSVEHREWQAQGDSVKAVLAETPKGQTPTPPAGQR